MIDCYIPLRTDPDLLGQAIESMYDQVDNFIVINNTQQDLTSLFKYVPKVEFLNPFDPMCFEQSINTAVKHSYGYKKNHDYLFWCHNDIIVRAGAVEALFKKYEEVKHTKWGVIYGNYDTFCLINPNFFIKEDIWGEVNLFPNYFGDNHRYRLMDLRGYSRLDAEGVKDLVFHIGSQTIMRHPYFKTINNLTFALEQQLYINIWGGLSPNELNADPTCGGLYPIMEEK